MPYLTVDVSDLPKVVEEIASRGNNVVLPVREGNELFYRRNQPSSAIDLSGLPKNSIREFLFPKTQKILKYEYRGSEISVQDIPGEPGTTVIFCARPCDAASIPIVEPLWNWDYKDRFFNERRAKTTLVTLACKSAPDESCFCVSVGLSPHTEQGSDVLLYPIDGGKVACRFLTASGESLKEVFAKFGTEEAKDDAVDAVKKSGEDSLSGKKRLDNVKEWLESHFEHPMWEEKAFRCIGCGTCTFLCPTCHCFDIQDESAFDVGHRIKNWDACQFSLFTLHTSGHNPRDTQPKRYRQRILHKYAIYPDKFGKILCTGCGRCVAYCPVNLSLYDVVATAQELAERGA